MVLPSEFKVYGSIRTVAGVKNLGNDIDLTNPIDLKAESNIYDPAQTAEVAAGSTKYRLLYYRYEGSESPVKDCSLMQFMDTKDAKTRVSVAFDPQTHPYIWAPYRTLNGTSDYDEIADAPAYDLSVFTVVAWFRTSKDYVAAQGMIVNKGGQGSDTAGENDNYSISIETDNKIQVHFETGAGVDYAAKSPLTYNNGNWHLAIGTYDGANLKLYMDGNPTPVTTTPIAATPETNAKPIRIGANSRDLSRYFQGNVDEIMIFNRAWASQEVEDYYNLGDIDDTGLVYQNKYGTDNGSRIGQLLTDETTAPAGSPTWLPVTNGPPSPANIGKFYTNGYIPFLVRYTITAQTPQKSIENDLSVFRLYYGIGSGQTGGDEEGGGQTGGDEVDRVVAVNADSGDGNTTMKNLVQVSIDEGCTAGSIFLVAGDDAYNKTCSGFFSGIKPVDDKQGSNRAKCRVALGNHDTEGSKESELRSHFGTSKNYFSFEVGNIHVLILDSQNSPTGSTQVNFADADLAKAAASSVIDWILVMWHEPFYTSSNSHHDPDEANMRTTYQPMFDKYDVDFMLTGHVHSIQLSYPVRNNKDNAPTVVSKTSPYDFSKAKHGAFEVVNGTLGHDTGGDLYSLGSQPSWSQYQNDSDNMMFIMKFTNKGKTCTANYVNIDGNNKGPTIVINK